MKQQLLLLLALTCTAGVMLSAASAQSDVTVQQPSVTPVKVDITWANKVWVNRHRGVPGSEIPSYTRSVFDKLARAIERAALRDCVKKQLLVVIKKN